MNTLFRLVRRPFPPLLRQVRWGLAAGLALALGACAHGPALAAPGQGGGSLAALVDVDGAAAEPDGMASLSASAWLERALDALQNDRPELASDALRAALATGDLNDAGRALAYWYVYVADQAQGHGAAARNALADFVVVGEEVLIQRNDVRFADRAGSDFVDRFDLQGRLARSRATLSLAWAEQTISFGRSAERAVPVHSSQEMAFFLELAPPCAHQLDRRATEEVLAGQKGEVTRVDLSCEGSTVPARYFFATDGHRRTSMAKVPSGARRQAARNR